jgi:LAGLIDADG-like domain
MEFEAYLLGALKDGTFNRRHRTHRIGQRERSWLETLRGVLDRLGCRAWIYREGRTRDYWVLETSAPFLTTSFDARALRGRAEGLAYERGFFDSDGGVPRHREARFYVQFVQKDREVLAVLRDILEDAGISCGSLHVPSVRVDPDYWRFYVRARSHRLFASRVGSWHPRKGPILRDRFALTSLNPV